MYVCILTVLATPHRGFSGPNRQINIFNKHDWAKNPNWQKGRPVGYLQGY